MDTQPIAREWSAAGPAEWSVSLFSWEQKTSGFLETIGLRSIKIKIIIFALLATLIPSLTMGWLSYRNNRRAIDEKVIQELTSLTSHASRELGLWLRERRVEMKVLSSSYEVLENLVKINRPERSGETKAQALRRLQDYLGSIGKKFEEYGELFVVDLHGAVLASSTASADASSLGEDWLIQARGNETINLKAVWDPVLGSGVMVIAEPIRTAGGTLLGAMGAKVSFRDIDRILRDYSKDPTQELYLVTRAGEILTSSRGLGDPFMKARLEAATVHELFRHEMTPLDFRNYRGTEVLGALRTVPDLAWGVVAEKDRAAAYSAIVDMRNVTLALISTVLLGIGLAAYVLGLTIVRPLGRLTQGAAKVAGGNLEVSLPVHGRSEVSYMTAVFNEMVGRLRRFRDENAAINQELRQRNDELHTLSITDSLTGLYNRAQLPELLARELARAERHRHSFSILMIDIDHFKRFNDTHGHQTGDDLLRHFAGVLKSSLRSCDLAARYGGEEFLVLLTETGPPGALSMAEKLRASVEASRLRGEMGVTVSIGVASYPDNGEEVELLISQADAALYECKRGGRNRVTLAKVARTRGPASRVSSG